MDTEKCMSKRNTCLEISDRKSALSGTKKEELLLIQKITVEVWNTCCKPPFTNNKTGAHSLRFIRIKELGILRLEEIVALVKRK